MIWPTTEKPAAKQRRRGNGGFRAGEVSPGFRKKGVEPGRARHMLDAETKNSRVGGGPRISASLEGVGHSRREGPASRPRFRAREHDRKRQQGSCMLSFGGAGKPKADCCASVDVEDVRAPAVQAIRGTTSRRDRATRSAAVIARRGGLALVLDLRCCWKAVEHVAAGPGRA